MNTSEQAEWASIGSALCITELQYLQSSLQSPKSGRGGGFGFAASSNQCPSSPTFSSATFLQHYTPNPLTVFLDGKTSIYTSGQWLICGTYNGWGSASKIAWSDPGGTEGAVTSSTSYRGCFSTRVEAEGGKLKAYGSLKKWNALLLICEMILQVLGFFLTPHVLAVVTQLDSSETFCSSHLNDGDDTKSKTWKLSASVGKFTLQNKIFSPGTWWVLCRFNFSGWRKCCKNNSES